MEKSSNPSFFIRQASIEDAPSLLSIYRPYVENTAITFEEDLPSLEDFQHRMASTLERYPYLAALSDGRIAGYAYAGPFHPRKAYDHAAELSIYIAPPFHHRGLGKALYGQLGEGNKRSGMERPFPDFLSHPDHVIPAAEFIPALFKAAQGFESKTSVK